MFESLNVMSGYFNAAAHVSVVPEPAAIFPIDLQTALLCALVIWADRFLLGVVEGKSDSISHDGIHCTDPTRHVVHRIHNS